MTPALMTLEGESLYTTPNARFGLQSIPEVVGFDLGDILMAPVRGIGHAGMEIGRGVSRGDIGRIFMAPVKGVGHTLGETIRGSDLDKIAGPLYRPSQMRKWMPISGPVLTAVAPLLLATPLAPAVPFMLAGGAALSLGGKVADVIYTNDQAGKLSKAQAEQLAKENKKNNMLLLASAGIGAIALYMMAKGN